MNSIIGKSRDKQFIVLLMLLLVVAGCHPVGPDYQAPESAVAQLWQSPMLGGLTPNLSDPNSMAVWWQDFNDPELASLISRAVAGNMDLKSAYSRVLQARAYLSMDESELYPRFDASGTGTWSRSNGRNMESYSVGLNSHWELDVFGGVRRSLEASKADIETSRAQLHDVLITLTAEVAVNYIQVRQVQSQIQSVQDNLELQTQTHELTCWRNQAGLNDELAVRQSLYNLESSRAQLPVLNSVFQKACNRIAVLLGEQPGMIQQELSEYTPVPSIPVSVAVGVPADIIRRRPDIRQAESTLISQTARVGVATANLYPRLTLSGSISVNASALYKLKGNVFDHSDWFLQGGPQLSWNVFDAGRVRKSIKIQSLSQEQALLNYEKTVLAAQEEVENALTAYADEQLRHVSLTRAASAASEASEIAQYEYESGLADFSNVLESQRVLLSFQNQLIQSQGTMAVNLVRLYKSLGGGWDSQLCVATDKKNYQLIGEEYNHGK